MVDGGFAGETKEVLAMEDEHVKDQIGQETAEKKNRKKKKKKKSKLSTAELDRLCSILDLEPEETRSFKFVMRPGVGRDVVATKTLEAGTVVCSEDAIALIICSAFVNEYCCVCSSSIPQAESESLTASPYKKYCSATCMTEDAPLRALEEAASEAIHKSHGMDNESELVRLIVRLLAMRTRDGANGEPLKWPKFMELVDHYDEFETEFKEAVIEEVKDVLPCVPEHAQVSLDEVIRMTCRINANSHGITATTMDNGAVKDRAIGCGVYPLISMFNHSCCCTCINRSNEGRMEVRTIKRVEPGERLTISYINPVQGRADRQEELLVTRFFRCECDRCTNPPPNDKLIDGYCCGKCGADGLLEILVKEETEKQVEDNTAPKEAKCCNGEHEKHEHNNEKHEEHHDRVCVVCKAVFTHAEWLETEEELKKTLENATTTMNRKEWEDVLSTFDTKTSTHKNSSNKKQRIKLHPNNRILLKILSSLATVSGYEGDYIASVRYLERMIVPMQAALPEFFPELGVLYRSYADQIKLLLEQCSTPTRKRYLPELHAILQKHMKLLLVCRGADSMEYAKLREEIAQIAQLKRLHK